jgi:peptidoglycan/xylan/chitin deacetylase (PgdA/CDA1 family)
MINSKINRGLKKAKWHINDVLFCAGLKSLKNKGNQRSILVYHGITVDAKTDINARFVSTYLFEKQIQYFKTHFNIVTVDEYFKGASHPTKLTVAITFDDGYKNNLIEVLPILEKHKVPATFYITTVQQTEYSILWADALDMFRYTNGYNKFLFNGVNYHKSKNEYVSNSGTLKQHLKKTGWKEKKALIETILSKNNFINNKSLKPYFELLSNEDIYTLSQSKYASIGSHGLYHNCLAEIPLSEAKQELITSKNYLENITQKTITSIAYPDGSYNNELINIAEQVGFKTQLAVDFIDTKNINDPRIESRLGINPYISFNNQIQCLLDGKY